MKSMILWIVVLIAAATGQNNCDYSSSCRAEGGYCTDTCNGSVKPALGCGRRCSCCIPPPSADVRKVSFAYSGGTAFASNTWKDDLPMNAFLSGGGYQGFWASSKGPTVNLWFEFPTPIRVVEYSFASRPDTYMVKDGPSKYRFWASNERGNCATDRKRETLDQDMSGIHFTENNEPKKGYFINSKKYYCYGFEVLDVPGRSGRGGKKFVSMANVQYYEIP